MVRVGRRKISNNQSGNWQIKKNREQEETDRQAMTETSEIMFSQVTKLVQECGRSNILDERKVREINLSDPAWRSELSIVIWCWHLTRGIKLKIAELWSGVIRCSLESWMGSKTCWIPNKEKYWKTGSQTPYKLLVVVGQRQYSVAKS